MHSTETPVTRSWRCRARPGGNTILLTGRSVFCSEWIGLLHRDAATSDLTGDHMLLIQQHRRYNAGMTVAITIRNVPNEVRDELAARAARSGRSLQEFLLRQLAELASRPTVDEVISRARARAHASGTRLDPAEIVAARDADRR